MIAASIVLRSGSGRKAKTPPRYTLRMEPDWRSHFPLLEETTYLASHDFGAMSYEASDALARYAEEWATLGTDAWREEWSQLPLEGR